MNIEPTAADIRKLLSSHGHPFQYAVLRRADKLFREKRSKWVFEVAEFPLGEPQNVIHIDFILTAQRESVYLVAECKRADPALASWCFVKAPYTRRDAREDELVFQEVEYRPAKPNLSDFRRRTAFLAPSSHRGFVLRTPQKGEGTPRGRDAINDATTQVLRAMNGLVNLFQEPLKDLGDRRKAIFLPVIFTTAKLWFAEGDLSEADLEMGQLPDGWGQAKPVPWLWFNYNQSPTLRHQLRSSTTADAFALSQVFHAEYTRTIAVVGPDGIDEFLHLDFLEWL